MSNKISSLIFDIGNVLLPFDYQRAQQRLSTEKSALISSIEQEKIIAETCKEYEHGRKGRAEFLAALKEAYQYRESDENFIEIWCDIFQENTALHHQIPFLASLCPLYLLSNIGCIHREFIHNSYPIFAHFTAGIYSYEVGVMKPHLRIYQIAQELLGIIPEETLFIDDLVENVEAARSLGFHGFVYDWRRHDLFESALSCYNLPIALSHLQK